MVACSDVPIFSRESHPDGGCIVVLVNSADAELRVSSVDRGRLQLCLQLLGVKVADRAFEEILCEFRKASGTDNPQNELR